MPDVILSSAGPDSISEYQNRGGGPGAQRLDFPERSTFIRHYPQQRRRLRF